MRILKILEKITLLLLIVSFDLIAQTPVEKGPQKLLVIPIGLDAYMMWEKLPYHKIGIRAYMRSTYDREGNNRRADASHYLYQESDTFNVTLDVKGSGVLYFKRTNHFHGSPWHYEVDAINTIVKETATDDPVDAKNKYGHFTYSDQPGLEPGKDVVFLDTKVAEGGGDWSGHFVGMSWFFTCNGVLHVLEGDLRFFFDDSKTPQAWGTGSEEWGGGGDYWGGETMTIPLAGHSIGKNVRQVIPEDERELINSAYRFLIADYFPFGKRAVIGLEHGGLNLHEAHMSGVVYWYGVNKPSLILTDELNVCHPTDRVRRNYTSPTANDCYNLVSRYEWVPDTDVAGWANPHDKSDDFYGSRGYFFAEEDSVRTMTGITQFSSNVIKDNYGVLLRRKFDYLYPNQEAGIYVRHSENDDWNYVGTWYTAGSNTCVFSWPEGQSFTEAELAPAEHNIITSNRRWREEEFIISSMYTQGADKIDIKLEFVPDNTDLFPGNPFPAPSAWSKSRYWIYSYVLPDLDN